MIVSGGRPITGWTARAGRVWSAAVPGVAGRQWYFRHLFVGGRRAVRARTPNADAQSPSWQLAGADLAADLSRYTLTLPPGLLAAWSNPTDIEVMVAGNWEINRLPVQSLDPAKRACRARPAACPGPRGDPPRPGRWCHLENAPELLDQPGEWYLDRPDRHAPLLAAPGEDMTEAGGDRPAAAAAGRGEGHRRAARANLHFRGLRFAAHQPAAADRRLHGHPGVPLHDRQGAGTAPGAACPPPSAGTMPSSAASRTAR